MKSKFLIEIEITNITMGPVGFEPFYKVGPVPFNIIAPSIFKGEMLRAFIFIIL
jgi:hypothetical protein